MTAQPQVCPLCDQGTLIPRTYGDDFKHHDGTIRVEGLEYCECDHCGADPVLKDQVRRNHRRIADAKRRADGLLSGEDILGIRARLELSQQEAAQLFGGGANAFSKYERGDVIQSVPMDRLLRLVAAHPELVDELCALAGIEAPASPDSRGYGRGTPIRLSGSGCCTARKTSPSVVVELAAWNREVA